MAVTDLTPHFFHRSKKLRARLHLRRRAASASGSVQPPIFPVVIIFYSARSEGEAGRAWHGLNVATHLTGDGMEVGFTAGGAAGEAPEEKTGSTSSRKGGGLAGLGFGECGDGVDIGVASVSEGVGVVQV